jgi:signal transduction histidine kinase
MAYVLPLLLGLWIPGRRYVIGLAVLATVASVLARTVIHAPPEAFRWLVWMNRVTSWVAIWSTATLLLVHKELERTARVHQRAREELLQALDRKNTELEQFAYTVAHDLKSPLVTIKGFLGGLERSACSGDLQLLRSDINLISTAADRMRRLLDALLELSRIGRVVGAATNVPLDPVVAEALAALSGPIASAGVTVRVSTPLPAVRGDRLRLVQVFQNLIENSVKFTADSPEPRVEVAAYHADAQVIAYVKDNGIGVEPRHTERIFNLFEQLDRRTPGSGVGLALVRRVVEVHGGRVWVESRGRGTGSSFLFTLPAASSDDGVTPIISSSRHDAPGRGA